MKIYIIYLFVFLFSLISSSLFSQSGEFCEYSYPSTLGCNNNFFVIDSADNTNCIWQYGYTVKPNFETYYPRLITDTLNSYPAQNYSSISLIITTANVPGIEWFPIDYIRVAFIQTMESDTLADGGYIEFSEDNGLNWMNAYDTNYNTVNPGYSDVSSLFNGELGFSGNFKEHDCLVEFFPSINTDTVLLRIVFISDSINTNKGGWQLNSLGMSMWIKTNIDEVTVTNNLLPNPLFTNYSYSFDNISNNAIISIYNISGMIIYEQIGDQIKIPGTIQSGIYTFCIKNTFAVIRQKILILNE